jgi:hypothetical protein
MGRRIMQSSQNPSSQRRVAPPAGLGLSAERAVLVNGNLQVLPIEERIS